MEKKYNLRPYQTDALNKYKNYYYGAKSMKRGILRMFCGTGKSYVLYMMMRESYDRGARVFLYCVPYIDLAEQTIKNLVKYHSDYAGEYSMHLYTATSKSINACATMFSQINNPFPSQVMTVIITTYKSVSKSTTNIRKYLTSNKKLDMFIFDEAHNIGTEKSTSEECIELLDIYQSSIVVFATATPLSYNSNRNIRYDMKNTSTYGNIFYSLTYNDAINITIPINEKDPNGHVIPLLASYKVVFMDSADKPSKDIDYYRSIVLWFYRTLIHTKSKRLVAYTPTQQASNELCNVLISMYDNHTELHNRLGGKPKINVYHSNISSEKRKTLRENFINDDPSIMQILITVQTMNEGVDLPICDGVLFTYDKKCMEHTLVQNIGRALRRYENNPNKIAHIYIPTMLSIYEDHCGGKYYNKIRNQLNKLSKNEECEYYSAEKGYYNDKSSQQDDITIIQNSTEEIVNHPEQEIFNSDTLIWDPTTDHINKILNTTANVEPINTQSIANLSIEQFRERLFMKIGSEDIISVVKIQRFDIRDEFIHCLYKNRSKCQDFISWHHLCYHINVIDFETANDAVAILRNNFDKDIDESLDIIKSTFATVDIDYMNEKLDKAIQQLDSQKSNNCINKKLLSTIFNMYIHSEMINAPIDSVYWKLPPKWVWTRIYSVEHQSGIDIFDQFKWDADIKKISATNIKTTNVSSNTIDGKLPDTIIARWVDFKLSNKENKVIMNTLVKCFKRDITFNRSMYKKNEHDCVVGFIIYKMGNEEIKLTLHGKLTGHGYNNQYIGTMGNDYQYCLHVLSCIRDMLEE